MTHSSAFLHAPGQPGFDPPDHLVESAKRIVVRTFPNGGNQLEAAIELAFTLGWDANAMIQERRSQR